MIRRVALRHLVCTLAFGLCAFAHAQTSAPPASAPDAERKQVVCGSTTFVTDRNISVPPGAKLPPQGVVVRVLLEYGDLKAEPAVTVSFNSGDQAFADAVTAVVRNYRFDCIKEDIAPLRYTQEIQFVGGDAPKVIVGRIRPVRAATATAPNTGCLKSANGGPVLSSSVWSAWASKTKGSTGSNLQRQTPTDMGPRVVIAAMAFKAPDVAPEASILFSRAASGFEDAVLEFVAEHRWSCMKAGDPPFKTAQTFRFVLKGEEPVPNRGTLQQFLGVVDKLTEQKVRFDFTTMGCPFKFRLNYLRPFTSNGVTEIGGADPNRREFVLWLKEVTFKPELNPDNKLVDRDFEVNVPCLVLDLT